MNPLDSVVYGGVQIVEAPYLTDLVTDWSDCRSRARAERRARRGFPQRTKMVSRPKPYCLVVGGGTLIGHPETISRLLANVPVHR